jgi:hypothetical protein
MSLPCLIILHAIDDGGDRGICKFFYPPMFGELEDSESSLHGV